VLNAVGAVIALRCSSFVWVNVEGIIRTGLHARLAADATLVVEVYDTVVAREQRRSRAYCRTRRVLAVVAAMDTELSGDIWVGALLDVLDMSPIHSNGNVVFRLAGDRAGMAADALPVVYHEAVVDHSPPSLRADTPSGQMSLPGLVTV